MTAKDAIKERCKDCCGSERIHCDFDSCELRGLAVPKKGCNRSKAIAEYCKWCMNGHHLSMCISVNCALYKYRHKY